MPESCIDPSKPSVDNESLKCEQLISTDCIISEEADVYLRYGKGATLTIILGVISRAIRRIRTSIENYLPSYKVYAVILKQETTTEPIEEVVIQNSKGLTPVYTRTGVGEYVATSVGSFIVGKYIISSPNRRPSFSGGSVLLEDNIYVERIDDDSIYIKTSQKAGTGPNVLTDGLLDGINTVIEIKFYD